VVASWIKKHSQLLTALLVAALFLAANSILLAKDFYYLWLLPVVGLAALLFFLRLETGLMAIALLTPFAVDFALVPGMELSMPVEPMMILFTLRFFFRVLVARNYDVRILRHPVAILVLASLAWMLVTSCTSQIPGVSFKYFAARLWFVVPFFFASVQVFRDRRRIRQFFWCYASALIMVILISTLKTLGHLGDLQTLHRVMQPFYNDHTAYGCVIALFLPTAFYFIFSRNSRGWAKILFLAMFLLLLAGLMFSYSRAAWISVIAAVACYCAIRMGMKVKWMVLLMGCCVGAFFYYQSDVLYKLGKNKQDSSYELADQVKSISNISTDASNLERLNRWASAMRMFKERPVLGCGPGTYQFLYAGYQRSYQKSVISTDFGNRGNAHSEYIGPLTEQGVPGAVLVVGIFMATFATGVRVYRTARDKTVANTALAFTLSMLTYYVHGVFNNFLDTDKLSVPFWGFTAVIVALDLYASSPSEPSEEADASPIQRERKRL
jgi:O-antigen ligase